MQLRHETRLILVSLLETLKKTDKAITKEKINAILSILDEDPSIVEDQVISRERVASLCNISPKMVDVYCRNRVFQRVKFRGSTRASGISLKSVMCAINEGIELDPNSSSASPTPA